MAKTKRTKAAPTKRKKETLSAWPVPAPTMVHQFPFLTDFEAQRWGRISKRSAFGVYGLALFTNYPDYRELATVALTEGPNDKDVDLCHIDREAGCAYVAQVYVSDVWGKTTAPTNKADDLLTALSWLTKADRKAIPTALRKKAIELQDALEQNEIETIYLLFIHNCRESESVRKTLDIVEKSGTDLLRSQRVQIRAEELSLDRLQKIYASLTKLIVVEDEQVFECPAPVEENGEKWHAVLTTIKGADLHQLWQKHGDDLCSANIRGFLDMLRRRGSVNRGIYETIQDTPKDFWAFNNGVTILTKKIDVSAGKIRILGMSIINGAQTTGVIGKSPADQVKYVRIPCRFIECESKDLIEKIIEFNNTQNAIKSFDLRSNDPTQRKLQADFARYGIQYVHRRQGAQKLSVGGIQAESLAPYLAAFHGEYQYATRQRRLIFEDKSVFDRVFPKAIRCEHAYLIQALADAVIDYKETINESQVDDEGSPEKAIRDLLGHSTSNLFVVAVLGELASTIFGKSAADRFRLVADAKYVKPEREKAVTAWRLTLEAIVPLMANQINGNTYDAVRSGSHLKDLGKKVGLLCFSMKKSLASSFQPLRDIISD